MMKHARSGIPVCEVPSDAIGVEPPATWRSWSGRRLRPVVPHASPGICEFRVAVLPLPVLAVLANACHGAACVADVPMRLPVFRYPWRGRRWMPGLFGVSFGMALARYWLGDEILPAMLGK